MLYVCCLAVFVVVVAVVVVVVDVVVSSDDMYLLCYSCSSQINPSKMKGMSKKQLRNIKKTSVNKFGQVELVDVYNKA
jgi:hypothetical protein